MRNEITAIIRIQLALDRSMTPDEIEQSLDSILRNGTRWTLSNRLGVVEVLGVDALDDVRLAKHIDLQSLLARQRQVAIVWEVDDVLVLRPDLSDDQAWEVLQNAQQEHDAEIGLNWHALEAAATLLFGPEPKPVESTA